MIGIICRIATSNINITVDSANINVDILLAAITIQGMPFDFEKVKALREKRGLTQKQAAEAAGLSHVQAWSRIENGGQLNPGVELLEKIAAALGVKAKDLLK